MRVAQLDMTVQEECPSGLTLGSYGGKSLCGSQRAGCSSVFINTYGVPYTEVCGYVAAYQDKTADGFRGKAANINLPYLDGISITRGRPRKHIWSLAAGLTSGGSGALDCPCNTGAPDTVPFFVGHDYYCESGNPTAVAKYVFFPDVLWNGKGCTLKEVPCCKDPWMPYFRKDIGEVSTEGIELRLCHDELGVNEDIPIESYEFFIR